MNPLLDTCALLALVPTWPLTLFTQDRVIAQYLNLKKFW